MSKQPRSRAILTTEVVVTAVVLSSKLAFQLLLESIYMYIKWFALLQVKGIIILCLAISDSIPNQAIVCTFL
jgi:hypothetical protein